MAAAVSGAALLGKGLDISLAALRQHDPYISSIVDVASQVALYTFGHRANEWVRRGTAPPPDPKPRGARGGARGGHAHCGEAPPLSQPWGGEGVAAMLGCEGSWRDPGVPQGAVCVLKALLMGNGAEGLHGCLQGWSAPVGAGCHTRAVPSAGCSWGLAAEQPHCSIIHRPACIPSTPPTLSSLYPVHNSSQNWPHKPCSLATIPWSCGACFMASLGSVMLSGLVKERKKRGLLGFGKPCLQLLLMSFCSGEDRCGGNAVCLHKVRALCFNI